MLVKFQESIASAQYAFAHNQVADIPDYLAPAWIASGVCVEVVAEIEENSMITPAREDAARRGSKRNRETR